MNLKTVPYLALVFLCLLSIVSGYSQSAVTIYDAETLLPLPYANVTMVSVEDGKRLNTTSTENGSFELPFSDATEVVISYVGYQEYRKTVQPNRTKSIFIFPYESEIEEVIITGEPVETAVSESMIAIDVITKDEIEKRGAVNLRDALMNELNISLVQDGVLGTNISMQGLSGENVKVMIDGVPVIGRQNGNVDLSQINLNNIERIEVVEGPLSVIYGTNAIAGVINLITKKSQKETFTAQANTFYESTGIYNLDASLGFKKKQHYLGVSAGRYFFDGWSPNDYVRDMQWNPKEQYFAEATYVLRSKKDWFHRFKTNYYQDKIENRYDPFIVNPVPKAFEDWYHTRRTGAAYILNGRINDQFLFSNTTSFNHFQRRKHTYLKDLTTLESEFAQDDDGNIVDQDTTVNYQFLTRSYFTYEVENLPIKMQFGYDISHEAGRGERFSGEEGGNASITDVALFTSFNYQPNEKFSLQPSLRYGYNSRFTTAPTPSIALKYNFNPRWTMKASYGVGYRAPSLKELYLVFYDSNHKIFGNEDLDAEKSQNVQTSVTYKAKKDLHNFTSSLSGFYNHKSDAIALTAASNDTFTYVNISDFTTLGGRFDQSYRFKGFTLNSGVSLTGVSNSEHLNDPEAKKFFFWPQAQLNLSYKVAKSNTTIAMYNKYHGARHDYQLATDTSGIETLTQVKISDYLMMDITVSQGIWKNRIQIQGGLRNLFNVSEIQGTFNSGAHSSSNNTQIATGRSYFVGLKFGKGL